MRRLGEPPPRTGPSRRWESRCACTSLPPLPGEHHQLEPDRIPRRRALRNARTPPARRLEAEVSEPYQDERPDDEHTNGIRSARARRERDERIHPSRLRAPYSCLSTTSPDSSRAFEISRRTVRHNVVAFARAARVLGVPVVLTSTAPMMWGPTLPELTEALPGVDNIERSVVNAWDESRVRDAVTRTGRQKLLMGGITTHVCLAFPAMSAVADGYDVYALLDASGTWSDLLRLTAIEQMRQAGVTITSGAAAFVGVLHDKGRPIACEVY